MNDGVKKFINNDELFEDIELIMKRVKPFIALIVLILIIFSSFNLYQYNKLQKEVKSSCGYSMDEDVYCICDKNFVSVNYGPGNPYNNLSPNMNLNSIFTDQNFSNINNND